MFVEVAKLEDRINELRKELIAIAETTGLNSHDTLHCSQTLDQHITIYQKYLQGSHTNTKKKSKP
jgi:hypothetical protein